MYTLDDLTDYQKQKLEVLTKYEMRRLIIWEAVAQQEEDVDGIETVAEDMGFTDAPIEEKVHAFVRETTFIHINEDLVEDRDWEKLERIAGRIADVFIPRVEDGEEQPKRPEQSDIDEADVLDGKSDYQIEKLQILAEFDLRGLVLWEAVAQYDKAPLDAVEKAAERYEIEDGTPREKVDAFLDQTTHLRLRPELREGPDWARLERIAGRVADEFMPVSPALLDEDETEQQVEEQEQTEEDDPDTHETQGQAEQPQDQSEQQDQQTNQDQADAKNTASPQQTAQNGTETTTPPSEQGNEQEHQQAQQGAESGE